MKIINQLKKTFLKLTLKKRLLLLGSFLVIVSSVYFYLIRSKVPTVSYETAPVTKGSLITSISGTGTITSVNNTDISSKVSGSVNSVYVSNGDTVTKGQKIADIELDDYGQERQTSAWKSYLDAQEAVKTAEKNKASADIDMWQAQQTIIDAEDEIEYKNNNSINPDTKEEYTQAEKAIIDKNLAKARLSFVEAETKYKNADSEISAAKAQVTAAWRDYQKNASTIVAPANGIISNLNLAPGMAITSSTSSNSNASENSVDGVSAQTFGKIQDPNGSIIDTISLSEVDVISVKANQKATLILDAYEDKSFTGKVLAVDTSGQSTSGVTSYSVTIVLDPLDDVEIYSNMAVTADIITNIQNDVLLVPTTAILTLGDQSTVQVKTDDLITTVTVEIGNANDSQTIINSGLNEGDQVITSTISTNSTKANTFTNSPFSGIGGVSSTRSGSGGGAIMIQQGGPPGGF